MNQGEDSAAFLFGLFQFTIKPAQGLLHGGHAPFQFDCLVRHPCPGRENLSSDSQKGQWLLPESTSLPQTSQKSCISLLPAHFDHIWHLLQMGQQLLQMVFVGNFQNNAELSNILRGGSGTEFNNIGMITGDQ